MSLFWNTLSGKDIFPFKVVIGVSVLLTILVTSIGWLTVTLGSNILLHNNADFQKWKKKGGRPYWDSLGWPINTSTPLERRSGLAEPTYDEFTPPANWKYQCPVCGARVEKQIDVCWRCFYGANGDSTAYYERWGNNDNS